MVAGIAKTRTGIVGFDELTGGGLPAGRTSLVCGAAGCGKTIFGLQFLARGAMLFDEPGVLVAFEESPRELVENAASLGLDLDDLQERGLLYVDHVAVDRAEIEETGEYDLEGLFVRIGYAIDRVGAKRVVLDTLEALFASLPNEYVLRSELRRLFRWLKDRGVTAVVTAERGEGALTRHGLEEYVSDCVVVLDHRVNREMSTRRLRVLKYRGSGHGTNEYPFLLDDSGITVLPVTSVTLAHDAPEDRVSTGIPRLDEMLGGQGFYRASSVLVSGPAGTGKTTIAAHFVDAACRRGERALFVTFEESPRQLVRNMRTVGMDLTPWESNGLLRILGTRPTLYGHETHLAVMHRHVIEFAPSVVVIDPITNLVSIGSLEEAKSLLMRLVDLFKTRGITAIFTSLGESGTDDRSAIGLSSLIDTWINVRELERDGERNRGLYVLKSRGMPHSNQVREFVITPGGIDLLDVRVGPEGVLVGSARDAFDARERLAQHERALERERRAHAREARRKAVEAQIAALRADLEQEESLRDHDERGERTQRTAAEEDWRLLAILRQNGRNPTGMSQ